MNKKFIFLLIGLLIAIALGVWGYDNIYMKSEVSHFNWYYKLTNLAIVILLIIAFAKNIISEMLQKTFGQRAIKYETSFEELEKSNNELESLKSEKSDLKESFEAKKQASIDLVQKECAKILENAKIRSQKIEAEQKERLDLLKRETKRKMQLILIDQVIEKTKLQLKDDVKAPDVKNFDEFFKLFKV